MIRFYACDNEGFVEMDIWQPHYWVNVECPSESDCRYLRDLGVPDHFMESVSDVDERPRFEHEDGWLLTILRIPHHYAGDEIRYTTVPLGVMTKGDCIIPISSITSTAAVSTSTISPTLC